MAPVLPIGLRRCAAFNWGPFRQHVDVAFPMLLESGVDCERRLDLKVQGCLVVEIDGDGVVIACGEELDLLGGFASGERKLDKLPARKRSLVENELTRSRGFAVVVRELPATADRLLLRNGAISFGDSHVASMKAMWLGLARCVNIGRSPFI